MKLHATIRVKGNRLDYGYYPSTGEHVLWKASGQDIRSEVPGEIVNHLVPYRDDNREVQELIRWLMK